MERAFIMSDGEQIQPQDLAILDGSTSTPSDHLPTYGAPTQDTAAPAPPSPSPGNLQTQVDRFEAALSSQALAQALPFGPPGWPRWTGHLPPPEEKVPSPGAPFPESLGDSFLNALPERARPILFHF